MPKNLLDFEYSSIYNVGKYCANSAEYQELKNSMIDGIGPIYEKWWWMPHGDKAVMIFFLEEQDYMWFILKYQ